MAERSNSSRFAWMAVVKGVSFDRSVALLCAIWAAFVWLPFSVLLLGRVDGGGLRQVIGSLLLASVYAILGLGALLTFVREFRVERGKERLLLEKEEAVASAEPREVDLQEWQERLEEAQSEAVSLKVDLERISKQAEEELARNAANLESAQGKLAEMEEMLRRRNKRVGLLEQTARDLNYQLRTVLQLGDLASASSAAKARLPPETDKEVLLEEGETESLESIPEVTSQYDAYILLHRCLQTAQALAGRYKLEGEGFRGMAPASHAIDLRRLFDRLRAESSAGILAYSPDERRLLFTNERVQRLLGWGPDKLMKDFSVLIRDGKGTFEEQLQALRVGSEAALRLVVRAKSGHEVQLRGCVGVVPSGAFQGLVIAIVYCS